MSARYSPVLLVLASLLAACAAIPEAEPDPEPEPEVSPWAGPWEGRVDGHVRFSFDWEVVPYCSGPLEGAVEDDGTLSMTGTCLVLWGPIVDEVFDTSLTGTVDEDGIIEADLEILYEDPDVRSWEGVSFNAQAPSFEMIIETEYLSEDLGRRDAFVVVQAGAADD